MFFSLILSSLVFAEDTSSDTPSPDNRGFDIPAATVNSYSRSSVVSAAAPAVELLQLLPMVPPLAPAPQRLAGRT